MAASIRHSLSQGQLLVWKTDPDCVVVRSQNHVDLSIMNGIRRAILSEVPTVGFDPRDVTITSHRSRFHPDFIAQRLSFVPIKENRPDRYEPNQRYLIHGENSDEPFQTRSEDPVPIMSGDLKCYEKLSEVVETVVGTAEAAGAGDGEGVAPASAPASAPAPIELPSQISESQITLLVMFKERYPVPSSIHLEAIPSVNVGRYHASFIPATVIFRNLAEFELKACRRGAQILPDERVKELLIAENQKLDNPRHRGIYPLKEFKKDDLGNPECVELRIETSTHRMDPEWVLWHAVRVLHTKVQTFSANLRDDDTDQVFISSESRIPNLVEMVIPGEDDTLGQLVKRHFLNYLRKVIEAQTRVMDERVALWRDSLAYANNLNHMKEEITLKFKAPEDLKLTTTEYVELPLTMRVLRLSLDQLQEELSQLKEALLPPGATE